MLYGAFSMLDAFLFDIERQIRPWGDLSPEALAKGGGPKPASTEETA